MSYLIDTNIIIYSIKGLETVRLHFVKHADAQKFISAITYGELCYGAHKSQHKIRNMATVHRIAQLFPVIDIDRAAMDIFGELKASLHRSGTSIDDMDLLIAATALQHNHTLVTNNERHFMSIKGLSIENWTKE